MGSPAFFRRRWVKYGLEVLLFVAIFLGVAAWQKRNLVEGPAPVLVGKMLNGETFDLAAPREMPVLVHFWATWCPVCKAEEGTIAALAADPDHTVITVAMESGSADEVRHHLEERGIKLPVLVDSDGAMADVWKVGAVPATFVVDATGHIRFREVGYTSGPGLRLRLWWAGWR